jgi:3-hydroxyisobutyrate dehydrogenase
VANGLDPKVLSEIMRRSSGGNWALEKYNPYPGVHENAPASKGYAGGFGTDLMLKDLGLAQENATAVKASTPLGGLARAIYAAHSIAGHGGEDFSSVIKMLQKLGGAVRRNRTALPQGWQWASSHWTGAHAAHPLHPALVQPRRPGV